MDTHEVRADLLVAAKRKISEIGTATTRLDRVVGDVEAFTTGAANLASELHALAGLLTPASAPADRQADAVPAEVAIPAAEAEAPRKRRK